MILSPVEIKTDEGMTINGVLLEAAELGKVVDLINRSNADGLKGDDALLLMQLKNAERDLCQSTK